MSSRLTSFSLLAALMLTQVLMLASCAKDPITGKRELVLVSEAQEVAMGQQASGDVEASMGLYDDPALQPTWKSWAHAWRRPLRGRSFPGGSGSSIRRS